LGADRYLDLMGHDKKVEGGRLRFVLLKKIGDAFVTNQVPNGALRDVLSPQTTHA
jgi:3-dehydroquinate synthase